MCVYVSLWDNGWSLGAINPQNRCLLYENVIEQNFQYTWNKRELFRGHEYHKLIHLEPKQYLLHIVITLLYDSHQK